MERHFKAKPADVNRPFHLFETQRISLSRVLFIAIQTSVIVVAFIGFLWCLWKLPQENNEFPDGLIQCPPSSYRILNERNITIACKTCPVCPAGQRPTLPCGSSIFPKSLLMFTECISSKTVSEENGYGEALKVRLQTNNLKPTTAAKVHNGTYQSTASSTVPKAREEKVNTALEQKNTQLTTQLNSSYSKDVEKLLSILTATAIILTLVVTFIAVIVTCIFWKIKCCPNCCQSQETTILSGDEFYEAAFSVIDDIAESSSIADVDADTADLQGCNLGDIPLDLEHQIALKLDYRRNGERLPGWEKVGIEFQIDQDVLKNLENEFRSLGGSPTTTLLRFLGSRGRTVADLVNALKSPNVNYRDVAFIIQKYYGD